MRFEFFFSFEECFAGRADEGSLRQILSLLMIRVESYMSSRVNVLENQMNTPMTKRGTTRNPLADGI